MEELIEFDSYPYEISKLSEEHGWISLSSNQGLGQKLKIGQKVRVLPNHSCPVVNLAEKIVVYDCHHKDVKEGNVKQIVFEEWKVQNNVNMSDISDTGVPL